MRRDAPRSIEQPFAPQGGSFVDVVHRSRRGMDTEQKPIVMLVEDHDDTREAIERLISQRGLEVIAAANGREALDRIIAPDCPTPCVIILDLHMPELSGWEFLAIVKSYYRLADVPIVVISATPPAPDALAHGAVNAIMKKPLDFPKLLATVETYCKAA